jgi:lysophospholipase L1-like esterase
MQKTNTKAAVILVLLLLCTFVSAEDGKNQGRWVAAWSTAIHTPLPFPGLPPAPVFEKQTIRMVIRPTIGGLRARIRFSNEYGASPLEIGSAHIALTNQGASIVAGSDHAITFNGKPSVVIPAGAPVLSDPVSINILPFTEVSVTIYLPRPTPATTTHFWAQHDTYISGSGDFASETSIPQPTVTKSWYYLAGLEVWTAEKAGAVVAFGDSITDGVGAKQGDYEDWPDVLAKRLAGQKGASLSVLNEGIGGNRILYDGAGVSALARLDRDVLAEPGVRDVILLEGINDIGWPHMKLRPSKDGSPPKASPFAGQGVTADDLILGMRQIIDRAHEHHIRVFGATLTPYQGADYFSEDGEQVRQAVNQWIRTGGAFDGVFDFDAAVRDPEHPAQFREAYQSGDHLHPSAAGYKAMVGAIDLGVLQADLH